MIQKYTPIDPRESFSYPIHGYVISFLYDSVIIPYAHTHWVYRLYTYIMFLMTIDVPAWPIVV